jgi:cysteine-rich repeat protein
MKKTVIFLASLAITLFILSSLPGTVNARQLEVGGLGDFCDGDSDCDPDFDLECSDDYVCVRMSGYGYGTCGNGFPDEGEECDERDGNDDYGTCNKKCEYTKCGDGLKQRPNGHGDYEECDDSNVKDVDGCSSECTTETIEFVKVGFDPDYKKETQKSIANGGRGFELEKITPYDDIICVAKVYAAKPPAIEGNLVVGGGDELSLIKKNITNFKIINEGEEDEHFIYTWKISGWDKGWSSNLQSMAILSHREKAECQINFKDNPKISKSKKFPVTSCVHLYGKNDAKFKFVEMYGISTGWIPKKLINQAKKNFNDGIMKIEPYKSNYLDFAYFVDIKRHADTQWTLSRHGSFFHGEAWGASSCGKKFTNYAFYSSRIDSGGHAHLGGGETYLNTQVFRMKGGIEYDRIMLGVAFHELGHSFGSLLDEYLYKGADDTVEGSKNCVLDPTKFGKYQYGDFIGCYTMPKNSYPSVTSIMHYPNTELRFNVISCGYILRKILGNKIDLPTSFDKCAKMDVMKEGACAFTYDCNSDESDGCYECKEGQCQFTKVDNPCKDQAPKTFKWRYGKCNAPSTFRDPICFLNPRWECNEDSDCRNDGRNLCEITEPGTVYEMHVCV